MGVSELSRGGLKTQFNRTDSLANKFKANTSTTATVSGKSSVAQSAAAALKTATRVDVSRDMMSNTGSILSKQPASSNQVAVSNTPHSSSQVTSGRGANKRTGSSRANGFVPSGHAAQQEFKFNAIRRSHTGSFLESGSPDYSNRSLARMISNMSMLNEQHKCEGNGTSFMDVAVGIGMIAKSVATVWDAFDNKVESQGAGNADGSNPATSEQGGDRSSSSAGLSMITNAQNSAELSSGIALAKNEKTKLEGEQNTIKKDIETQTKTNNDLKGIFNQQETAAATAKTNRETAETNLKQTKESIKGKEGTLATLKSQLAAAPEAQKASIQAQIRTTKAEIQKLKETEAQQVQDLDKAQKAETKANDELTKATNDSAESQTKLNNLNTSLKANQAKIKNYENQFATAQKKLEKMQQEEQNDADKLQESGLKNINSGMNKLEKGKNTGNKKVNKGTDKLNAGNTKEQLIALSKAPQVVANGKAFATTTDNLGKAIYSINGKLVSESEYKTQFEESKQQEIKAQLQSAPATNFNGKVLKTVTFEGTTAYSVNDSIVTKEEYEAAAKASA